MKGTGLVLALCLVFQLGCQKDIQSKEAIRQGVIEHLAKQSGLNVGSMDVEVSSVMFRGTEADATVSFRAKGSSDPGAGMSMRYTLEQKGSQWVVKNKEGVGANPHGAGGMPAPADGGTLPPGHPQLGTKPQSGPQSGAKP